MASSDKSMNSTLTTAWVIVALIVGLLVGAAVVAMLSTDQTPVTPPAATEVWVELDGSYELGLLSDGNVTWRRVERKPIIPRPKPDGTGAIGLSG